MTWLGGAFGPRHGFARVGTCGSSPDLDRDRRENRRRGEGFVAGFQRERDVDGWTPNLAGVFGGRIAIDYDHSSDRGGGTRAAAWIAGLHPDGKPGQRGTTSPEHCEVRR